VTTPARPTRRFAWTSTHAIGWTQFPLPPRRIAWLAPTGLLAAAVAGGSLWGWAAGAPGHLRLAALVVGFGIVAGTWFHLRQLAQRRVPTATLWPGMLFAVFAFGPLNFLLTPPSPADLPTSAFVEDHVGRTALLSSAEGQDVEVLWLRLEFAEIDAREGSADKRLDLYDAAGAAVLRALTTEERASRGDAGELGLPLLGAAKRPRLDSLRIVRLRLDSDVAPLGATATATDGRATLRFRLVRTSDGWRFAAAPVEID
jgi:hypothetical protein